MASVICPACGNSAPAVEYRAPFCLKCWNVAPQQTREAYQAGTAGLRQVVDAVKIRRVSVAELRGGKRSVL